MPTWLPAITANQVPSMISVERGRCRGASPRAIPLTSPIDPEVSTMMISAASPALGLPRLARAPCT